MEYVYIKWRSRSQFLYLMNSSLNILCTYEFMFINWFFSSQNCEGPEERGSGIADHYRMKKESALLESVVRDTAYSRSEQSSVSIQAVSPFFSTPFVYTTRSVLFLVIRTTDLLPMIFFLHSLMYFFIQGRLNFWSLQDLSLIKNKFTNLLYNFSSIIASSHSIEEFRESLWTSTIEIGS